MIQSPQAIFRLILGIIGATLGGFVGHLLFFWIARQGFYALVLPGVFAGLGASLLARRGSILLASAAGLIALVAGIATEWRFAPFSRDPGFPYFLSHLTNLRPWTLVSIVAGALLAFWLARRARWGGRGA